MRRPGRYVATLTATDGGPGRSRAVRVRYRVR
jgi:hypothetical protein